MSSQVIGGKQWAPKRSSAGCNDAPLVATKNSISSSCERNGIEEGRRTQHVRIEDETFFCAALNARNEIRWRGDKCLPLCFHFLLFFFRTNLFLCCMWCILEGL